MPKGTQMGRMAGAQMGAGEVWANRHTGGPARGSVNVNKIMYLRIYMY